MATITAGAIAPWDNYHHTHRVNAARTALIDVPDLISLSWPQRWATTAALLHAHIAGAQEQSDRAGLIGRAWSLSQLTGNEGLQLDCGGRLPHDGPERPHSGLTGCAWLETQDRHPDCAYADGTIIMAGGGATLREIVDYAQSRGRSIMTSGSHLAPSVAGAIATGTNGSRLGYGAVQNQIVGLHLVTGDGRSVWIEPQSAHILTDAVAAQLDEHVALYRDDAIFADALVHLGGMGAVNGVALLTCADVGYDIEGVHQPRWPGIVEQLANGDFAGIAQHLDISGKPAFYELTADHRAFGADGDDKILFHTFYLTDDLPATSTETRFVPRASDGLLAYAKALGQQGLMLLEISGTNNGPLEEAAAYYIREFDDALRRLPNTHRWADIHGDIITGGHPGDLYSCALAINRADLVSVLPLLSEVTAPLPPAFLFTLRFVSGAAGTMAFTHFAETAVIDIEGVSRAYLTEYAPEYPADMPCPAQLAVRAIRAGLTAAGIAYCMHWAKQGTEAGDHPSGVDEAALIERNFGPAANPASRLARWRATRARLLSPTMQAVFTNRALLNTGVLPPATTD